MKPATLFRLAALLAVLFGFQVVNVTSAFADDCVANPNPYKPVAGLSSDRFPICYEKPADSKYQQAFDDLQKRQILERYAQFLAPVRMPHNLTLKAMQCTPQYSESPFYSSDDRTLHFCYEWYQVVLSVSPASTTAQGVTRDNVITGFWAGVLMHETGHALFDMLDVPVFGREEDAADETAAFVALQFNKDVQRTIINGLVYSFQMMASGDDPPTKAMNPKNPKYPKDAEGRCSVDPFCSYDDVHGTMSQRLYNTLCLAYGADKETFKNFVQSGLLPPARAANCAQEYQQILRAFSKTVYPFIDQDKLKIVQSTQWLLPDELK